MQFENTETFKNLARSFAGECQAGMRYQMIAKLAMQEKYKTLSDTLKTIAKNETLHATQFFNKIIELLNNFVKEQLPNEHIAIYVTQLQARYLANKKEYAQKRSAVNARMKHYLNTTLPDTVIYFSPKGEDMLSSSKQSFCWKL